jgi:mono/diheme cytochrome c family protein
MDRQARLHHDPDAGADRVPRHHRVAVDGALAIALAAAALGLSACGGGDSSASAGEKLFRDNSCGSCHAFAATGSTGSAGPNLDEASLTRRQVRTVVHDGVSGMPAYGDRLSDSEINDLADFVVTQSRAR